MKAFAERAQNQPQSKIEKNWRFVDLQCTALWIYKIPPAVSRSSLSVFVFSKSLMQPACQPEDKGLHI